MKSMELNLKPKITVIFDRSAFHSEHFLTLFNSNLTALINKNVIRVHHTQIFLEETLAMYEKEKYRQILKLQMPFILDICNGRWLQDREKIWEAELIYGGGKRANIYVSCNERKEREILLRERLSNDAGFPELTNGFPERLMQRKIRDRQFALFSSMRDEVAQGRESIKSPGKRMKPLPEDFIKSHTNFTGLGLICRYKKVTDPHALYYKWHHNKRHYPFFTSFVEGFLYSAYHAMVEVGNNEGKRIDRNSQADIEQLTCLAKADYLISNDRKFMLDAFNVIWKPKGETIMTTDEFVDFLAAIS